MFDLTSAVVLAAVVMGLVFLLKTLLPDGVSPKIVAVLCVVVGILAVLIVGASDFAHDQVVLNRPLDSLNLASQILVGFLVGGGAAASYKTLSAISNIGQTTKPL